MAACSTKRRAARRWRASAGRSVRPRRPRLRFGRTDAEGRFALRACTTGRIASRRSAGAPQLSVATVSGIYPEREELDLRIESAQLLVPAGGSVVDARPARRRRPARARRETRAGRFFYPEPSGDFDIGPLPPGAWADREPPARRLPAARARAARARADEVWLARSCSRPAGRCSSRRRSASRGGRRAGVRAARGRLPASAGARGRGLALGADAGRRVSPVSR
jgi:hypothetical protein